jgi:hypothetical protein
MDCISPSEESKLIIVYLLGCFYFVLLTVIKLSLATYYIDNKVIDLVCQIFSLISLQNHHEDKQKYSWKGDLHLLSSRSNFYSNHICIMRR